MRLAYLLLAYLLLSASPASNSEEGGIVCTGRIGGEGSGNFRGSSCLEAQGKNPTLSIFDNGPASTKTEAALVYGARRQDRKPRKTASISVMAVDTNDKTGFNVLRFNSTHTGGKADDVFLRGFADHGATFFGKGETDYLGRNILAVRGTVLALNGAQVDGTEFMRNSAFLATTEDRGIVLGHSKDRRDGIIACDGAGCGIQFWTHDGFRWGMRLRIAPNGALEINGPTQQIDGNNYLSVSVNGKPSLIQLQTVESLNAGREARQHAEKFRKRVIFAALLFPLLLLAGWYAARRLK